MTEMSWVGSNWLLARGATHWLQNHSGENPRVISQRVFPVLLVQESHHEPEPVPLTPGVTTIRSASFNPPSDVGNSDHVED